MKRRFRSTNSRHLDEERQRSSSPATISADTTYGMTSKRIDAAGTEMRKSAVTARIAVGGTTATKTG